MNNYIKVSLDLDNPTLYKFSSKLTTECIIKGANHIERLLIERGAKKDKIQNVVELFIETAQNMVNYAHRFSRESSQKEKNSCFVSLSYFNNENRYVLESSNLIHKNKRASIEEKLNAIQHLDNKSLRRLIRQKSRSKEGKHAKGAGLGFILMSLKSTLAIEVQFIPYGKELLEYKQKLTI